MSGPRCCSRASGDPRTGAAPGDSVQGTRYRADCTGGAPWGHPQAAWFLRCLLQPLLPWSCESLSFGMKSPFQDLLLFHSPTPSRGQSLSGWRQPVRAHVGDGPAVLTGPMPGAPCDAAPQLPGWPRIPTVTLARGSAHTLGQGAQGGTHQRPHLTSGPGQATAPCIAAATVPEGTEAPGLFRNLGALQFRCRWAEAAEWVPPAQSTGTMWGSRVPGAKERRVDGWPSGAGDPREVQSGLHGPGVSSSSPSQA